MSRNKHLTKLCIKCLLYLKYVLALPWEIWSDRLSRQRSTYMYILMKHWIATNTTGSHCLRIVKRVVSHIICLKCPPPARTRISDVDELKQRITSAWTGLNQHAYRIMLLLNVLAIRWRQRLRACVHARSGHFEHDVKMMRLTTTIYSQERQIRFLSHPLGSYG